MRRFGFGPIHAVVVALALLFCAPRALAATDAYKVGTFTKSGAVNATDTITHNLGEVPKAIILWTTGQTLNDTYQNGYLHGFGITDLTTQLAISNSSNNGTASSQAGRAISLKALQIISVNATTQTVLAACDYVAGSATTTQFQVRWTTNDSAAEIVHWIAIGGTAVSAKATRLQMPLTAPTAVTVTGTGFQPDVVIFAYAGGGLNGAPPFTAVNAGLGIGAMDAGGNQFAAEEYTVSNSANSDTQRGFKALNPSGSPTTADAAILTVASDQTDGVVGEFQSMNANGYTVNFTKAFGAGGDGQVIGLALKGVHVHVGSFLKSTTVVVSPTTTTQTVDMGITGGFVPNALLFAGVHMAPATTNPADGFFGMGDADGASTTASSFVDQNALATMKVRAITSSTSTWIKMNTTPTTLAKGSVGNFQYNKWDIVWSPNDNVGDIIHYIAFGTLISDVKMESLGATRDGSRVAVNWSTGEETQSLGFNVYRESRGQRTRITPTLVAGTALMTGDRSRPRADRSYAWVDALPSDDPSVAYWIEDISMDGKSGWHGPIRPRAGRLSEQMRLAPTIAQLGTPIARPTTTSVIAPEIEMTTLLRADPALNHMALARAPVSLKIGVREKGWYRITTADLIDAGLDPRTDPRNLQLWSGGAEVAIRVRGEDDGTLDAEDAVEFYATGRDTPYTDTRAYWLVVGQKGGARIGLVQSAGHASAPASYLSRVERADRSIYIAAIKNGEADNYFGPILAAQPADQVLATPHPDLASSTPATLEVTIQGLTLVDHRVDVSLNGVAVGSVAVSGQGRQVAKLPVPAAALHDGDNTVRLATANGDKDVSLVESVAIVYPHVLVADGDALLFTMEGRTDVTIGGFSEPGIVVMDVTEGNTPREIVASVTADGATYAARVASPGARVRTLYAFLDRSTKRVASIRSRQIPTWHDTSNEADLVILSDAELLPSVAPLRALRKAGGLAVQAIDVEDIYDEYGFGEKSPFAIRRFLEDASRHWRTTPRALLLVGDATFDPRGYLHSGLVDRVPTKLVETDLLETASDDWFTDFNGDDIPDLTVGRLPAASPADAETMIAKITQATELGAGGTAVLVSDEPAGYDFAGVNKDVQAILPGDWSVTHFARAERGATIGDDLLGKLAAGVDVVSYVGHGSVELWAGNVLTTSRAPSMPTGARLPTFVNMTCLNGFFHDIYTESLAEALMRAKGAGGVAVWASSSLTDPVAQRPMDEAFFQAWVNERKSLGEAARFAKTRAGDFSVKRSWVLFGDPTMQLMHPAPAPQGPDPDPKVPAPQCDVSTPSSGTGYAAGVLAALSLVLAARRGSRRRS
jgi:hypothetical protein